MVDRYRLPMKIQQHDEFLQLRRFIGPGLFRTCYKQRSPLRDPLMRNLSHIQLRPESGDNRSKNLCS